jgi:hypothetical protein
LFSYVHEFFQSAFFYLSSNLKPPTFLARPDSKDDAKVQEEVDIHQKSETTWNGQLGTGEGLWQKGWTIAIVGALHAVELQTGIPSSIMGHGDNQVIVISLSIPHKNITVQDYISNYKEEIETRLRAYRGALVIILNVMGMKLK